MRGNDKTIKMFIVRLPRELILMLLRKQNQEEFMSKRPYLSISKFRLCRQYPHQ